MKFQYNPKIDKQCWKKVNARDFIFGEKKKEQIYPVDKDIIKKFRRKWSTEVERKFQEGMCKIFGANFPKNFICYINSTPYSMEINKGISISASTQTPIRTICHEANHYIFRKSDHKRIYFPKYDIEDAKEIFTIVNNIYFQGIMENQDIGWKRFWKKRYKFLTEWIKNNGSSIDIKRK